MQCPHCGNEISDTRKLVWGPVEIYVDDRLVFVDGDPVKVTKGVYGVLEEAIRRPQRILTPELIRQYSQTWDKEPTGMDDNNAKAVAHRINKQLGIKLLVPEWGVGYRLNGELLNG